MKAYLNVTSIPLPRWPPGSASSRLLSVQKFIFDANLEFPPQKTYKSTCMIIFLVSHLYTWIRTAPSRIQPLPGVQKFIFNAKFGIPTPKNLYLEIYEGIPKFTFSIPDTWRPLGPDIILVKELKSWP